MVELDRAAGTVVESSDAEGTLLDRVVQQVRARMTERRLMWATYRLQFQGAQFKFVDAQELADYFADLGVSHLYSSPALKTRRGSTHGYDVVDHTQLNDEVGTPEDFTAYVDAIHQRGLGQILDIVPNHMCVAADENAWWMDVLMNGAASPYAVYFDIDWVPVKRDLEGKVLLPILGDLYGNMLEAGELPIVYRDGAFYVRCYQALLPLDPQTWPQVLLPGLEEFATSTRPPPAEALELQSIVTALQNLPSRTETTPDRMQERQRERLILQARLRLLLEKSPAAKSHVERNLNQINGTVGDPHSFDRLDVLLQAQAFRLGHWKAGSDELNYRRFFDITELAALSMENIDVFDATHCLLFDLVVGRQIDGFRIDHIDGLFDPRQYLWRLQWAYLRALGKQALSDLASPESLTDEWAALESEFFRAMYPALGGPDPQSVFAAKRHVPSDEPPEESDAARSGVGPDTSSAEAATRTEHRPPLFVVVEKILGADEPLPTDWPVEGTTGYDFTNVVNGLYVDPGGLAELRRTYHRFTGMDEDFREIVFQCKRLILDRHMQSEVQLLAHRLDRLSERHRHTRDYTLQALRSALREIIACFPVYRSYIGQGRVPERDRRVIQLSVAQARRRNPTMQAAVFEFVRDVLLLKRPLGLDDEGRLEREFFVGRFQQVTSPVMAKGVEDTALYRYFPLASINEVGGDPLHAVTGVEDFHRFNQASHRLWPRTMLATTTHDTKRSEDVRARINVLSEVPGLWRKAVQRWARWNRRHRREIDGHPAPSRNDEWLFYQTLVGIWPLSPPSTEQRAVLIERVQQYLEKACHEAKLYTSWLSPNEPYDQAVRDFVAEVLGDAESRFLQDFQEFHESIADAGLYASLSQVLLKLTSPGIPDIYQGQELWDFSLVDPDNRRPVDFAHRQELLASLIEESATPEQLGELAHYLAEHPRDDRTKLFVTWIALQFRRQWGAWPSAAEYLPLEVVGAQAAHVCAFAWQLESEAGHHAAIVVAPRWMIKLTADAATRVPCGPTVWQDTSIVLPNLGSVPLRDAFTGRRYDGSPGRLELAEILRDFPLALLQTEGTDRHPEA